MGTSAIDKLLKQNNVQSSSAGNNQGKPIEGQDYDIWAQEKREELGLKLTNIGAKEADFSLYMNTLSEDLKNEISDSFDCQEDLDLQAEIAAAYKANGTNFLHRSDIAALCKKNGWKLECESYSTSYIPDYKAGNFSNSIKQNGRISVYTISDGNGGSIMIADANGNGGLEIEEVYGNELLNGIVSDIQPGTSDFKKGIQDVTRDANGDVEKDPNAEDANNGKVSQAFFNAEVEEYINLGYSRNSAIQKAKDELKVTDLSYTGTAQVQNANENEDTGKDVKQQLAEETQELYNQAYEEYIANGETPENAHVFAKFDLRTNKVKYTG